MSYPVITTTAATPSATREDSQPAAIARRDADELRRMARHPISRWYLGGLVVRLAALLAATAVRPWHLTLMGAGLSAVGAMTLVMLPSAHAAVALLVWAAWLCDRLDGALARRQQTTTVWGAWLDANLDELADVVMHVAVAVAAVAIWPALAIWILALLVTFVTAKYLLMHGLWTEANLGTDRDLPGRPDAAGRVKSDGVLQRLYHLSGNADVRVHVLIVALVTGWLSVELALVAGYYALRVAARYPLVISRLKGGLHDTPR